MHSVCSAYRGQPCFQVAIFLSVILSHIFTEKSNVKVCMFVLYFNIFIDYNVHLQLSKDFN